MPETTLEYSSLTVWDSWLLSQLQSLHPSQRRVRNAIKGKIWSIKNQGYKSGLYWPYEMKEFRDDG